MSYAVKKVGLPFKVKLKTNEESSGHADGFTGFYKNDITGDKVDITGDFTEDSDAPGIYYSPEITIDTVADFTFVFNNDDIGMSNAPAPVVVKRADLDDIKTVVDGINDTVDNILSEVDGLDGDNLTSIKEELEAIHTLIQDSGDKTIKVSGDETTIAAEGVVLTGSDSEAKGTVVSSSYDSDADITTIELSDSTGVFNEGETVTDGTDTTTGTITEIIGSNKVDSVIEYVQALQDAINSGDGLNDIIAGYTDDIENILLGTEELADGSANPAYGKTSFDVFNKLSEALDGEIADSLMDKINSLKVVVDSNASVLADETSGLVAIKDALDALSAGKTVQDVLDVLENTDYGLSALKDLITNRFDTVDAKLDDIDDKITSGDTFSVFA